jgi:hypothetical protein
VTKVRNLVSAAKQKKTPYQLFTGKKPSVAALRVLGSRAHVWVPAQRRDSKLADRSMPGRMVGYSQNRMAWRIKLDDGPIVESRDVRFDESDCCFKAPAPSKLKVSDADIAIPGLPIVCETPAAAQYRPVAGSEPAAGESGLSLHRQVAARQAHVAGSTPVAERFRLTTQHVGVQRMPTAAIDSAADDDTLPQHEQVTVHRTDPAGSMPAADDDLRCKQPVGVSQEMTQCVQSAGQSPGSLQKRAGGRTPMAASRQTAGIRPQTHSYNTRY